MTNNSLTIVLSLMLSVINWQCKPEPRDEGNLRGIFKRKGLNGNLLVIKGYKVNEIDGRMIENDVGVFRSFGLFAQDHILEVPSPDVAAFTAALKQPAYGDTPLTIFYAGHGVRTGLASCTKEWITWETFWRAIAQAAAQSAASSLGRLQVLIQACHSSQSILALKAMRSEIKKHIAQIVVLTSGDDISYGLRDTDGHSIFGLFLNEFFYNAQKDRVASLVALEDIDVTLYRYISERLANSSIPEYLPRANLPALYFYPASLARTPFFDEVHVSGQLGSATVTKDSAIQLVVKKTYKPEVSVVGTYDCSGSPTQHKRPDREASSHAAVFYQWLYARPARADCSFKLTMAQGQRVFLRQTFTADFDHSLEMRIAHWADSHWICPDSRDVSQAAICTDL